MCKPVRIQADPSGHHHPGSRKDKIGLNSNMFGRHKTSAFHVAHCVTPPDPYKIDSKEYIQENSALTQKAEGHKENKKNTNQYGKDSWLSWAKGNGQLKK